MASSVADLLLSILVFFIILFCSWGLGDLIIMKLKLKNSIEPKSSLLIMAITLGLGMIGQVIFLSGLIGDAYQAKYFWFGFSALLIFSIIRFKYRFSEIKIKPFFKDLGFFEIVILLVGAGYLICWLWVALGFPTGSDVISHHYSFAKNCIQLKHFGRAVMLPNGMDHISNYNPTLVQMLYLAGKLLADDRAANLIHWLVQLILMMTIYGMGRLLFSRSAALFAVAIYLGFSCLSNYPLEAEDYTIVVVFLITSLHCLFLYSKTKNKYLLILASLFAGFMLSTKYYGLALMIPLIVACFFLLQDKLTNKIRIMLLFAMGAVLVYSPWVIYSLIKYGDPFYPFLLRPDVIVLHSVQYPIHTLSAFITSVDHNLFWPKFFYRLSAFIPFEPDYYVFGLSPVLLIAFPGSIFYLITNRSNRWNAINILFIATVIAYFALEMTIGWGAFYKWYLFPAVIYVLSIAGAWDLLSFRLKTFAWVAVVFVIGINIWCGTSRVIDVYTPLRFNQEEKWNDLVRYINNNLPPGETVVAPDVFSAYYLRPDLRVLVLQYEPLDWDKEEDIMRKAGVKYYVLAKKEKQSFANYNLGVIKILNQLKLNDKSAYMSNVLGLYEERSKQQELFIRKYGSLVKEFPGGLEIFKLSDF